jgi:RNA polymerase sigma factor (sigma-70 family)
MTLLSEDRELLAAFRAGRSQALEQVYRHYFPTVTRFLRRGFVVHRSTQAPISFSLTQPFELENAVQEVFARAFEERTRLAYDGIRPYRDFLFGIAKHVSLDELRRRHRKIGASSDELDLESLPDTDEASPEQSLETKQVINLVSGFIENECDARDRVLYQLRYGEDRSQEAAATAAGLTRIQVRRWESKFRARLLRYLKRVKYV